jgi:hypothetical protein
MKDGNARRPRPVDVRLASSMTTAATAEQSVTRMKQNPEKQEAAALSPALRP